MKNAMSYKGKNKKNHYFEGWYYKSVSSEDGYTISLIPGISKNDSDPHAFIQVIVNHRDTIQTEYVRYDIGDFQYDYQKDQVIIHHNKFGYDCFEIDIDTSSIHLVGSLKLKNHRPIQTSVLSPSIMGFFSYFPLMECNHDVVSMSHEVSGKLILNNKDISFNQGKGYMEKDYGRSFPEAYVWLQSNQFEDPNTSFMMSYATIPYLGFKFKGFIVNLIHNDQEYRFATYNFSKIKVLEKDEHKIAFILKKGRYHLFVTAENKETIALKSPNQGVMNQYIKEGLSGKIQLKLMDKDHVIFEDTGVSAGIEIMM